MDKLPLSDQLPYEFLPPRLDRRLVRLVRPYRSWLLRREHRVRSVEARNVERLRAVLGRGDGVLVVPNHSDRADGLVLLDLADRVGRPFCAMAAHQIFAGGGGVRRWLFPRLGIFPVDREGSDLSAFKAGVEILAGAAHPLLVFPEGEVYHTADRLTPIRDGAAALATTAAKRVAEAGRTVWVVPIGLKYRFLDDVDPRPEFGRLVDRLEARFGLWRDDRMPLIERIYRVAEATLILKEWEHLGAAGEGPLPGRLARLTTRLLDAIDERRRGAVKPGTVPERVKALRRCCLDDLAASPTEEVARQARRDLHDIFVAIQAYSYPGNSMREGPTLERVAEVLIKLEEDVLGAAVGAPPGDRRAVLSVGEPIDAGAILKASGKARVAVPSLSAEIERRIQGKLDTIGIGRPY